MPVSSSSPTSAAGNRRVVIVDEDRALARRLDKTLRAAGFAVEVVHDAMFLIGLMVLYASSFSVQILRKWDLRSGSERQLELERETYLISTVLTYTFGFQLFSFFLFVYTADGISGLFVGAMCAAGALFVNPYGYPRPCPEDRQFPVRRLLAGHQPRRQYGARLSARQAEVCHAAHPDPPHPARGGGPGALLLQPRAGRDHLLLREPVQQGRAGARLGHLHTGARLMGRGAMLCRLEAGMLADILVLDADPLADIRNTRRIHAVIRGGVPYRP